ncbi:MAG: hypothetical protein EBT30_06035 [Verrucomicrobia bacterium]|nr:hypothetical protein [Verrucomicrobiota bacterium]
MRMPDVNLLVYAHRREDPDHEFYRQWMENLANGREPFALSSLVAVAFVRVVTHPSFAPRPTPLPQALAVIDSLLTLASCVWLAPGAGRCRPRGSWWRTPSMRRWRWSTGARGRRGTGILRGSGRRG